MQEFSQVFFRIYCGVFFSLFIMKGPGFFWVKFGGGRIRGGGCVREGGFRCGVLCWFWAEGAHWCLAGALRFWVTMCV